MPEIMIRHSCFPAESLALSVPRHDQRQRQGTQSLVLPSRSSDFTCSSPHVSFLFRSLFDILAAADDTGDYPSGSSLTASHLPCTKLSSEGPHHLLHPDSSYIRKVAVRPAHSIFTVA